MIKLIIAGLSLWAFIGALALEFIADIDVTEKEYWLFVLPLFFFIGAGTVSLWMNS